MSSSDQSAAIEDAVEGAPVKRDMVQVLPTELVRSCFRLLDFRERIFVSHVSRAWRAVALNDCFLWTEAPSPYTRCHSGSEMLRILLARSDPLPFSFSWDYPLPTVRLPADTADVVCGNIHRMQTLYIKELSHDDMERLFRLPAPLLKTFGCDDPKGSPVLPALWPSLEDVRIVSLELLAAPQPFAAVRTFHCWDIIHFAALGMSLFSVFPALKTLRVRSMTQNDVACFSDPPSAMDEVSLGAADAWDAIDYTLLLLSFHALRVNRLRLQMAREAAGLVGLFSKTTKGPWRMEIDEHSAGTRAELCEDGQERAWIVVCDARISFYREPRIAGYLARLESLTGSITLLVELHNIDEPWSRSLPALRALTLQILRAGASDDVPVPRAVSQVHMPLLRSLTLWLDGMTVEIRHRLEKHLPALLPAILEQVPSVIIDVVDLINVRACDLAPLAAVAKGVLVQERRTG